MGKKRIVAEKTGVSNVRRFIYRSYIRIMVQQNGKCLCRNRDWPGSLYRGISGIVLAAALAAAIDVAAGASIATAQASSYTGDYSSGRVLAAIGDTLSFDITTSAGTDTITITATGADEAILATDIETAVNTGNTNTGVTKALIRVPSSRSVIRSPLGRVIRFPLSEST